MFDCVSSCSPSAWACLLYTSFPFVTTAHWVFDTRGALRYLTNWGERTVAVSDDIKDYLIREMCIRDRL